MTSMGNFITIIIAVLGSTGLATLIQFFVNRHDSRKDDYQHIKDVLLDLKNDSNRHEKDNVRTQLLVLMTNFPDEQAEIIRCAEHYFSDLGGNWYMTTLFMSWLDKEKLPRPEWLKNE